MVRPKKGKDPKQRLLEIFDNPVSDNMILDFVGESHKKPFGEVTRRT